MWTVGSLVGISESVLEWRQSQGQPGDTVFVVGENRAVGAPTSGFRTPSGPSSLGNPVEGATVLCLLPALPSFSFAT